MKTKRLRVEALSFALLLFALLVASAQARAAKPQLGKVKQTAKPVWTLAIDGPRVAYASGGRVYVWNVVTGAASVIKGNYSNATHSVNAAEIAIAGKRVAWIKRQQIGNTQLPTRLYTAQLGGSAHRLRRVLGYTDVGCGGPGGSQIRGVVGSGSVLAVSTWNASAGFASNRHLNVITPTRLRAIATGPNTIVSASADDGHIAILPLPTLTDTDKCIWTPTTSVNIYTAVGKLVRRVETGPVGAIALSGNRLVVEAATATPVFEVYDWTTGALVKTWPAPSQGFNDFAVSGRLAVYSVFTQCNGCPAKLHLLDLITGKDVVLAGTHGSAYRDLAMDRRGLVYVVNNLNPSSKQSGKLVFAPTELLAALSQ